MKGFFKYTALIGIFAFITNIVVAQDVYRIQPKSSKLFVEGTSTVHDWQVEAAEFNAETKLSMNGGTISQVSDVVFITPAEGLKSGKRVMDNKIKDALKTNKHPEIKFTINKDQTINSDKGTISGMLTIAGQSKPVDVKVDFDANNPEKFGVKGEVPLKMSAFNVEPPTAMMGTIKTGDDVVVKFDLEFQREETRLTRSN